MIRFIRAMLLVGLGILVPVGLSSLSMAHDGHPDNQLKDYWAKGAWEIWCIAYAAEENAVVCDLNIVVNYRPHPDFRAFIPRFYVAKPETAETSADYRIMWEYEDQTRFAGSSINTAPKPQNLPGRGGAPISGYQFADCAQPCIMDADLSRLVVGLLANANSARWHFTDHGDEAIDAAIDLDGFTEGLTQLAHMQARYGFDQLDRVVPLP